MAAESK